MLPVNGNSSFTKHAANPQCTGSVLTAIQYRTETSRHAFVEIYHSYPVALEAEYAWGKNPVVPVLQWRQHSNILLYITGTTPGQHVQKRLVGFSRTLKTKLKTKLEVQCIAGELQESDFSFFGVKISQLKWSILTKLVINIVYIVVHHRHHTP